MKRLGFIRALAISVTLSWLTLGCATDQGPATTAEILGKTTEIPVRTPCIGDEVPQPPASYADDDLPLGPGLADERYRLINKANEQRKGRLAVAEPALRVCRR